MFPYNLELQVQIYGDGEAVVKAAKWLWVGSETGHRYQALMTGRIQCSDPILKKWDHRRARS
jgi:hypothetical protein